MNRVLFVCLGNICRSPAAEGVFRAMAAQAGVDCTVDSAGTSNWHLGNPPYGPMIDNANVRGVDLTALRARQFQTADFAAFDLIIAMDRANQIDIEAMRPQGNETPVRLFLSFVQDSTVDVPDPYYTRDFDGVLDLIEQASRDLLARWPPK